MNAVPRPPDRIRHRRARPGPRPRRVRGAVAAPAAFAAALVTLAAPAPVQAAPALVPGDLVPASLTFGAAVQDGVRAHQGQVRARQNRIRDARAATLPAFTSGLTMSNERGSIPLQLRAAPQPGQARLVPPSAIGRPKGYVRGDLHSDGRPGADSALTTTDLTAGVDYQASRSLMVGLAGGRMATPSATGTLLSAYLTARPLERLYVDMNLSIGHHHARETTGFGTAGMDAAGSGAAASGAAGSGVSGSGTAGLGAGRPLSGLAGHTRALSLSVNHPRQIGDWTWQPYSRLDRLVTETEIGETATGPTRELSALSVGATAETIWTTPFGPLRPMVHVELQRERVSSAGAQPATAQTQSLVGFGFSTRVSRDVSAYAQSRYAQEGSEQLDRLVMLGVKFAF